MTSLTNLTPAELVARIQLLDSRLGTDLGAGSERQRLREAINAAGFDLVRHPDTEVATLMRTSHRNAGSA